MSLNDIRIAIRRVKHAKDQLSAVIEETFPIGSDIHWERGGRRQHGVVLAHGGTGQVRVENERTRKSYWIGMYNVVGYVE